VVLVLVAGTFDLIHPGHIRFIQEASKLGDVMVIVGRDSTVERIKGHRPFIPENQRLEVVKNLKGVKKAVLGYEDTDPLKIVQNIKPDILLLGPNQNFSKEKIELDLEKRGLKTKIIRMTDIIDSYPYCSTTKIVNRILETCEEKKEPKNTQQQE
jgi:FAD synthetase